MEDGDYPSIDVVKDYAGLVSRGMMKCEPCKATGMTKTVADFVERDPWPSQLTWTKLFFVFWPFPYKVFHELMPTPQALGYSEHSKTNRHGLGKRKPSSRLRSTWLATSLMAWQGSPRPSRATTALAASSLTVCRPARHDISQAGRQTILLFMLIGTFGQC